MSGAPVPQRDELREVALRVYAFRAGYERGLAAADRWSTVIGADAEMAAQAVDQIGKVPSRGRLAVLRQQLGKFARQIAGRVADLRACLGRRQNVRGDEIFESFDPVAGGDQFHPCGPSAAPQANPAANEEKRIAALVFAHRLSEASE